ncbi:MAG: hypothetical protein CVV47_07530 [Spirochaetae bacterium HGW-Spirochaetae-3]|jgi:hypothetical protein|nr:MAG: hypothetical protein CVV47_07530 [Spirochaetae bacterium HGW-Spirochaetae-3]
MSAFESLSPTIQDHVRQIAKTSGLPADQESVERLAAAWLQKKEAFEQAIVENGLEEASFFDAAESGGALALTYSGSLVTIGPLVGDARHCGYASIGLRTDVPESATEDASELEADIETDRPAVFTRGPVKSTSPIYKIAVAVEKMEPDEEEAMLTQVTQAVAEDFVKVNRTVIR